jgi:hypothetical protein
VAAEVGRNISARQLSRCTTHPESQLRNQGVQSKQFSGEGVPFVHKTKSLGKTFWPAGHLQPICSPFDQIAGQP